MPDGHTVASDGNHASGVHDVPVSAFPGEELPHGPGEPLAHGPMQSTLLLDGIPLPVVGRGEVPEAAAKRIVKGGEVGPQQLHPAPDAVAVDGDEDCVDAVQAGATHQPHVQVAAHVAVVAGHTHAGESITARGYWGKQEEIGGRSTSEGKER